jgi:RND family efflux transporter MFP subunit
VNQAKAVIEGQRAAISQANANVANIAAQIAKNSLRAPMDGIVSQQDIKAGEIAPTGVPVISIISGAKFQIEAMASEAAVARIKPGEAADVTLDAVGAKLFEAMVISIDPTDVENNGSPTYKVTLEFKKEEGSAKDGMSANVNIIVARHKGVLAVPEQSVIRKFDYDSVLLKGSEGKPAERKVQTGFTQNGFREIISGLNEGDEIVNFGINQ